MPYPYIVLSYPYIATSYPYIAMSYPYIFMSYPYIVLSYPYIIIPYPYIVLSYPYMDMPFPYSYYICFVFKGQGKELPRISSNIFFWCMGRNMVGIRYYDNCRVGIVLSTKSFHPCFWCD